MNMMTAISAAANNQIPGIRHRARRGVQQFKKQRPDEGARHAADSAENGDQNEMSGSGPEREIRHDTSDGKAAQSRRQDRPVRRKGYRRPEAPPRRNAEIFEPDLVGMDRRERWPSGLSR